MKKKNKTKFKVLVPVKLEKKIGDKEDIALPDIKTLMEEANYEDFWNDNCWRMIC